MKNYNKTILTPPVVMNTTITSAPLQIQNLFGFSIHVVFTGTPTGTFKLQGSNDPLYDGPPSSQPATPTNWSDIDDSSEGVSAAGDFMWNVTDAMYNWVRLIYTDGSSGASTAVITSAIFNGKGV